MPPDVEALADGALVAIAGDEGVLGTGFLIDDSGTVLTCHHVVDGRASIRLHGPDGSITEVSEADITAAPEIDLALIRAAAPSGTPLPLVSDASATTRYWAKGFHRLSEAIRGAFPVQGNIIGRTSIAYPGGTADYRVDNVFVLRDDSIDPGLSGAPVLDPDAGVVVAVVSTKFISESWNGGFAVPIGHAAGHPALRADVARNQSAVAAFGPYLNAPAARALCAEVTESELDNLIQLRGVDLGRRVPRKAAEAAMASFLGSDSPILALVGQSGVGKSTEMAALARRLPGRALLLRGSSLSRGAAGGVGEAIRAAVSGRRGKRPLPPDADELMARALSPDGGLIVLLDGLNEAPFSGRAFEEWVADTRAWLRGTTGRLVVSCRSELWGDLVGRALAAKLDERTPAVIFLAVFDDDEYRAALDVYGDVTGGDSPVLRLPLVLGLWSRYQAGEHRPLDGTISLNRAIEAYVEEAARSLAARGTGAPLSAHVMRSRLEAVAELMWKHDSDTVDITSLGTVLGTAALIDDLVSEGVMAAASSGYRFVYDDVSDWLQARTLDLDHELTAIGSGGDSQWRRVGPIAAALRQVELGRGPGVLCGLLVRLLQDSGDLDSAAFRVTADTLIKLSDARPYGQVLEFVVKLALASAANRDRHQAFSAADPDLVVFFRSVPLPLAQRLSLLHQLCRLDGYYRWRPKDWASNSYRPSATASDSYGALALYLVSQDPTAGIPALIPWLADRTPLAGDEAAVAHIAMGILYHLRSSYESVVRQILIGFPEQCEDLYARLAIDDPQFLARMVMAEPDSESTDRQMIFAARLILLDRPVLPEEISRDVYAAIAARYERGVGEDSRGAALNILIRSPDGASYVSRVVDAYQDGVPDVDEWTLTAAARRDADRIVVPILAAALDRGDAHRQTALAALGNETGARLHELADSAVLLHLGQGGEIDYDICRYAESRLWYGHTADGDLLAIIRRIIAAPAAPGREILMYPLTSSRGLNDPAQRFSLMREFIAASEGPDSFREIIQQLARTPGAEYPGLDLRQLLELLKLALGHLDPATADRYLFGNAYNHRQAFGVALVGWLRTGEVAPPGDYTRQMLALAEAGEDPRSAIAQLWRARIAARARDRK